MNHCNHRLVFVLFFLDIKYNAEKDKKQKFEAKQRTLQRVEDAKTKEKEKDKGTKQIEVLRLCRDNDEC